MRLELRSETEAEILLWVSFSGADEARAVAIRVLIYVAMATIVVLSTGKKLERKETPHAGR